MKELKKIITINGRKIKVILPKGIKCEDLPNNIITNHKVVNVGIRQFQKDIIKELKQDKDTINSFVQDAVDDKLVAQQKDGE